MCRNLFIILGLIAAACLAGCRKNQFTVDFDLPADVNETISLTYYAADAETGWLSENVVTLDKGKAQLVAPTVQPALVYISSMGLPIPMAVFYTERGDNFKVTGKEADPLLWNISGNEITDRLTAWRLAAAKTIGQWCREPEKTAPQLNKLVADYVAKNPSNPVAAILLMTYYDRRHDEAGFLACRARLKDDAALAKWSEMTARTDIFAPEAPAKLPAKILLKSKANGCDTIVPGRVPALLYFSALRNDRSKADKDSLRKLARHYSDSAGRVIAEISFERDSMSRNYAARRDSLKKVVLAWMPLGLSDPTARQLGVDRAPWAIVIGKNGKLLYSGPKLDQATREFRKELK